MRNLVQKLPFAVEFAVVVAGAFGLTIVTSLMVLQHPPAGHILAEPRLWRLIAIEIVQFLVLGVFLRLRGWKLQRLGLESHWIDGLSGLALAMVGYFAIFCLYNILYRYMPGLGQSAAKAAHLSGVLSPWVVAAVVIVSSFYEEFFVAGYIITSLNEKNAPNLAINLSVAVRLLYHLYQGVMGVILIIPIGLIFAYWYARSGRLWPVMVAHALLNLVSYLPYVRL